MSLQQVIAGTGAATLVNENFDSVGPASLYGKRPAATSGLTLGYYGGQFNSVAVPDGTVALTASTTNYVVADRTTGAVSAATTTTNWLNATDYLQLYQVATGSTTIAVLLDMRQAYGMAAPSGGMANPMTAAGDLIYGGAPSGGVAPPTRLAAMTDGYVLTLAAGVPTWAAAPGGFSNPMTAIGDLIVGSTSGAAIRLANGTAGQVLTAVSGAPPAWEDAPGSSVPQNSKSAAYTLVLSDAGKHIFHPAADTTARTWTIPANSSVAYPIGTALTFVNDVGAGIITIAITTDTMVLAGVGSTGSRTLAAGAMATALKITSTRWMISGSGLT